MKMILATTVALALSGTMAFAQTYYCDGSEGTGTDRNAVTGTRCPIGQPGWAMAPIGAPGPSDGGTAGAAPGKKDNSRGQKKRGGARDNGRSGE